MGFIRFHGYDVTTVNGSVTILSRTISSFSGASSPSIYINDSPIGSPDYLLYMSLDEIDEIYINKRGINVTSGSSGGTIRIYRKKIEQNFNSENTDLKYSLIKDGFQKEITFKNPKYSNHDLISFKKHGTIDWIPSLYTDMNGNFEFKIPTLNQDKVLLNIQGIDNEGNLYDEKIIITVN